MRYVIELRKLVYWLPVLMVVVACLACGSEGDGPLPTDQSTLPPTVGSPATATALPPSTPTNALDPTAPAESTSEVRPEIREFVDDFCILKSLTLPPKTWGDVETVTQTFVEHLQSLEIPEELEGMFEALQEQFRLQLDFARGQDPDGPVDFDEIEKFQETPQWKALEESYSEEKRAVDPDILAALDEC